MAKVHCARPRTLDDLLDLTGPASPDIDRVRVKLALAASMDFAARSSSRKTFLAVRRLHDRLDNLLAADAADPRPCPDSVPGEGPGRSR